MKLAGGLNFAWLFAIGSQIIRYSNFVGQLWYLLTFLFRLIIVTTIGNGVYGDEQSGFLCNDVSPGCKQACFNQFTMVSHLRFWSFQILSVSTPIIAFHFIALYYYSETVKIRDAQKRLENEDNQDAGFKTEVHRNYEEEKLRKRKKRIGKVNYKKAYVDGSLDEYPVNDKIKLAYFITTVMRLAIEGLYLYLTYTMYNYPDYLCHAHARVKEVPIESLCTVKNGTGLHFILAEFPELYPCNVNSGGPKIACLLNRAVGNEVVACFSSRPWEKTLFLRYMNFISVACFVCCVLEIVIIPIQHIRHKQSKRSVHIVYRDHGPGPETVSYPLSSIRSPPSVQGYTTTHAHADYPSRRNSYYEDDRDRPQHHPPPNETNVKKYDDYSKAMVA